MKPFEFRLVGECDATLLKEVIALAHTGKLKDFERWTYGFKSRDGRVGNCHYATPALLCDFVRLHRAAGWQLACGDFMQPYHGSWQHSWLEHGELVLNCSNAINSPIYLIDRAKYYQLNNAEYIERYAPGVVRRIFTKRMKFFGTPEFNRIRSRS